MKIFQGSRTTRKPTFSLAKVSRTLQSVSIQDATITFASRIYYILDVFLKYLIGLGLGFILKGKKSLSEAHSFQTQMLHNHNT